MAIADFNGDGFGDIAASVQRGTVGTIANAGRVDVYWGPSFSTMLSVTSPSADVNDFFGDDVAAADVTGDGISDLVVADPRETIGGVICIGRVYLFSGPSLLHLKTIENPMPSGANSRFGNAVLGQDFDGDGRAEVIATDERNHVYVFHAPDCDEYQLITRPPDPISGTQSSVSFGYFVGAGDVNADGWKDVAVVEPFAQNGQGLVFVALGPYFSDFLVLHDKTPGTSAEFGWGISVEDVDADGRLELLVGSDLATAAGVLGAGHVTILDLN
jgi:hypothetical protein